MAAAADFAQKLDLVLKALNLSRGRLAQTLGVDKSVVSRWVSGATLPTDNNMSLLTEAVARHRSDFGRLDWELDAIAFAARLGVTRPKARVSDDAARLGRQQTVAFTQASDGVKLAYGSVGHGPVVVKASNWMNHVETDFDNPIWAELFAGIVRTHRLIHYDGRGIGLSDWQVDEVSFEAFVRDLEAVIDASGAKRVSLLGVSMGGATAMAYAARHPERVEKLILHGTFATGRRRRRTNVDAEKAELFLSLMRNGWGTADSAFMKAFACLYFPRASTGDLGWFVELQNRSANASNAVRIRDACDALDVADQLASVTASTLVTHSRSDLVVPMEQGRAVAAAIPGARFVALDTDNHLVMPDDPAWPRFIDAVERHLAG
jgi:pimeloyl-ACP methyl ester carboxylesterase/transcriptional regulator with XRE-family HTH domain